MLPVFNHYSCYVFTQSCCILDCADSSQAMLMTCAADVRFVSPRLSLRSGTLELSPLASGLLTTAFAPMTTTTALLAISPAQNAARLSSNFFIILRFFIITAENLLQEKICEILNTVAGIKAFTLK